MRHRQEEIRSKGFAMGSYGAARGTDESALTGDIRNFGKIKVNSKYLQDAVLEMNSYAAANSNYGDKNFVIRALHNSDYDTLRGISHFFFKTSGIYERVCKYLAFLYRYDWFIAPVVSDSSLLEENGEVQVGFNQTLRYLDESYLADRFGSIALTIVLEGCYYGYVTDTSSHINIQTLPVQYCRSRYEYHGNPAVEFNMKYFDDTFRDPAYKLRILKMFPKDFTQGYLKYKNGKLSGDYPGDKAGWYLLDPERAFKLNNNGMDMPMLANAIPSLIDLADAQALDRKKTMQQLLKIIIQKLPLDKNGDLVFDIDEARDIHANTLEMLAGCVGVEVMTTFADIEVADMADSSSTTKADDLTKVERSVYNEFGVSHNLFNSESNMALSNSILNDEAAMRTLPHQFERLVNQIISRACPSNDSYYFRYRILETTIHNYKELAKLYKDHTQIGYSKMLPQIALGHSQSEIIGAVNFENEVLRLTDIMIPPLMSSTMSGDEVLGKGVTGNKNKSQESTESKSAGRPEKPDAEKTDKTIANRESQ